jgi:hypothetical protein
MITKKSLLLNRHVLNYAPPAYYVDATHGNDSNDGMSPESAWQTISKVNAVTGNPTWPRLFKRGELWREQLTVPADSLTFGSYGTGAKPKISVVDALASAWTDEAQSYENFTDGAGSKPIAWWYFEDSATPAIDSSGNGNDLDWNLTVSRSGTHVQGSYSAELGDDGSVTLWHTGLSAGFPFHDATTAFTMGFWAKIDTTASLNYFSYFNSGTTGFIWTTNGDNGVRLIVYGNVTGSINTALATPVNDGQWHHFVGRWNGGGDNKLSMWMDGVKKAKEATLTSVNLVTAATNFFVMAGGDVTHVVEYFVFTSALTDDQIRSIHTHGLAGERNIPTFHYTSMAANPRMLLVDGVLKSCVLNKVDLITDWWWYDTPNARIYVYDDPAGHTVEVGSARTYGIDTNGKNYVIIDGLDVAGGSASGNHTVRINTGSHDCIIRNCDVHDGWNGVGTSATVGNNNIIGPGNHIYRNYLLGVGTSATSMTGLQVIGNEIDNIGTVYNYIYQTPGGGLYSQGIYAKCIAPLIESNYVHNIDGDHTIPAGFHGIYLDGTPSAIVRYNVFSDCIAAGIKFQIDSDDGEAYYNICYHNGTGIAVYGSTGINVYNNVLWGADNLNRGGFFGYGIMVDSSGVVENFKNNIVGENIYFGDPQAQIDVESGSSITHCDYNCIYASLPGWGVIYNGSPVASFAAWQALGFDAHGMNSDPQIGVPDFHLHVGSPCTNTGVNVGLIRDHGGASVGDPPDIGVYEL